MAIISLSSSNPHFGHSINLYPLGLSLTLHIGHRLDVPLAFTGLMLSPASLAFYA